MSENELEWLPAKARDIVPIRNSIHTFLLKVASRCNLACDYCYVYFSTDQSWRRRPKFMSDEVASQVFERIAEHVCRHSLPEIAITFHGGEPLLVGEKKLRWLIESARARIPCQVEFAIQTNGTLLSTSLLELFATHDVKLGISIDGPKSVNDRHRRFRNGKSSHGRLTAALELIESRPDWARLLGGYLAVIDIETSPAEVFRFFEELDTRGFDILLPDAHHDNPPLRPMDDVGRNAYGVWMATFFDIWYSRESCVEIRYFEEIIAMLFGQSSSMEAIGAKAVDLIVVESDGEIEAVDTLKVVGEKATSLGLDVFQHTFDDALGALPILARNVGYAALCETCQHCSILHQCGGGYLPHRYSERNGFLNPSVYCNDIKYLVKHVRSVLGAEFGSVRGRERVFSTV